MENKIKYTLNFIILALFGILTLFFLLHHEIWADEAQVWLVVRDLDVLGILKHVRTEGHPLLWYFIITPFAKLNLPVFSMQIVNWFFVLLGASFLILKSPFNEFSRVSILISSAFLYWFPIISRSYCLIPILVFLLAWLYKKQKEHPFLYVTTIILLANTHIIMFGFCFALAVIFFYENAIQQKNKKNIILTTILFLALLGITLYLLGSQNENVIIQTFVPNLTFKGIFEIYSKIVFNLFGSFNFLNGIILFAFILVTAIYLFIKDKKIFFVFTTNLIYQSAIFIFIWSILPQRAFCLLFVCVFCLWTVCENKTKNLISILIAITFLLSVPEGITLIKKDLKNPFSDGKNTAEFIKKNIPQDAFILSNYPITTTPVSVYLPKDKWKFYYAQYNDFYTYTIWNKPIPLSFTPVPLMQELSKHETVYVIMSAGAFYEDVKPIYSSRANVLTNQERYNIYEFRR